MFWENFLDKNKINKLTHDITVDNLIIGGGITGLNILYFLKDTNTILVEASRVGKGITLGTTGKLTYLQQDILSKLLTKNYTIAKKYLSSQQEAIKILKKIIRTEKIDCNLEKSASLLIANKNKDISKLNQIAKFLKINNIKVEFTLQNNKLALKVNDTYVFNPLKCVNALKKILINKIYEETKIIKIKKSKDNYECLTNNGFIIKAKRVIFAGGYPFFLKPLWLPLATTIEKSYVVVTKIPKNSKINYITYRKPIYSYRSYQDKDNIYGIYLGSSHDTFSKFNDFKNYQKVLENFKIKEENVLFKWSNMGINTGDDLPLIGLFKKNLFIATGFNTWGMTNSLISGEIIRDLINNKANPYTDIFNPKRLSKYAKFYKSIIENMISYLKGIKQNKSWYSKKVFIKTIKGKRIGIFIGEDGKRHQVLAICPHLKCPLVFNEVDKTWDCPCHSSRFSYDGKYLQGPSKKDITY